MCDCLGKSICKINTCGSWRAIDQSAAAPLDGTTNVACTFENSGKCQEKIDMPVEYKMVQLGSTKRAEQMFNRTWQKDKGDFITTGLQMAGVPACMACGPTRRSSSLASAISACTKVTLTRAASLYALS
jgi:hypothetical protein